MDTSKSQELTERATGRKKANANGSNLLLTVGARSSRQNQPEIELNDANLISGEIALKEKSVQSWHRRFAFFAHLITLSARASTLGGIVSRF